MTKTMFLLVGIFMPVVSYPDGASQTTWLRAEEQPKRLRRYAGGLRGACGWAPAVQAWPHVATGVRGVD